MAELVVAEVADRTTDLVYTLSEMVLSMSASKTRTVAAAAEAVARKTLEQDAVAVDSTAVLAKLEAAHCILRNSLAEAEEDNNDDSVVYAYREL